MTTTINASPTNGIVQTADGSGVLKVQSNGVTTNALAWVNFNGTGTVAIRSSYNVSSITDNGTGQYRINFTNAMSDANYATNASCGLNISIAQTGMFVQTQTTTTADIICFSSAGTYYDESLIGVTVFGN